MRQRFHFTLVSASFVFWMQFISSSIIKNNKKGLIIMILIVNNYLL